MAEHIVDYGFIFLWRERAGRVYHLSTKREVRNQRVSDRLLTSIVLLDMRERPWLEKFAVVIAESSLSATGSIYEDSIKELFACYMFWDIFSAILNQRNIVYSELLEIMRELLVSYSIRFKGPNLSVWKEFCKLGGLSSRRGAGIKDIELIFTRCKKVHWNLARNTLDIYFSFFIDIKLPKVFFCKIWVQNHTVMRKV